MAPTPACPPGTFCWPELATSDVEVAARFYGALFDWEARTLDVAGASYTIFRVDGADVGGGYSHQVTDRSRTPRWNSYIAVPSVDAAVERARELGGRIIAGPADIPDVSRVAGVADPHGAEFYLWEARRHAGAGRLNEPGSLCWTELIAPHLDAAERFYTSLFDWASRRDRSGQYVEFLRGREVVAGMLPTPPGRGSEGSHWLPYFAVSDVDDAVQVARRNFGGILGRPMDIPMVGRSAVLRDPQGATFGVFGVNEAA